MRESHTIVARRVGQRLKELRGSQTQAEFAQVLGLSQAQYNRYETGKRLAPDKLLQAAASLHGLSVEQLVWQGGPAPAPAGQGFGRAVARLVELMDGQSQEDIYFFLRQKAQSQQKRKGIGRAAEVMEQAFRKAG